MLAIFGLLETFLSEMRPKNAERHTKTYVNPCLLKIKNWNVESNSRCPGGATYQPDGLPLGQTGSQLNSPNASQFKNNDALHNG